MPEEETSEEVSPPAEEPVDGMAASAAEEPEEKFDYDVESGFFMILEANGHWAADPNISKHIKIRREANYNDFFHAAVDLEKDINSMEIANRSVQVQQQVAAQMAQQIHNQKLIDAAAGKGGLDLSKIRR